MSEVNTDSENENSTARMENKEITLRGLTSIVMLEMKTKTSNAYNQRIFFFYLVLFFVESSQDLLDRVNFPPLLLGVIETAKY